MVVRSQEEVIVLTMVLSAEECLELHRETGAYVRLRYFIKWFLCDILYIYMC